MNKWYILLGVSALVLGGCGTATTLKVKSDKQEQTGAVVTTVEENNGSTLSSIKDLLALGKDQICEWSSNEDGDKVSGKMWIKGKNFRQSIVSQGVGESEIDVQILTDNDWVYIWNSKKKDQGMKMKLTEEQKLNNKNVPNQATDWSKKFNYRCSPTTVSETEMKIPTEVTFMDLQALQDQFKDLVPSGINVPTGE